jgi:hypothetical protein
MDSDTDVYDRERLHSLNGGLSWCEDFIVDVVLMKGTDTLEKLIQEDREGIAGHRVAQYADVLLAEFIRHRVLDGFRGVEAPMRAAYEPFAKAHQKREDTRLATEEATHAWEMPAEDFRPKLKALGEWAASAARARIRRIWRFEPNPFAYMNVVGTSSWLRTPCDFVKYHDSFSREINFIREMSEYEVTEGRLERPVGMSDFESSLKAFEAAQARVKALQDEEADAEAALDSARLKYLEERHKAIAVLQPLSEAGRWALFRLVRLNTESPKAG